MRHITFAAFAVSAVLAASPSLVLAQHAEVESPGAAKHQVAAYRTDQVEVSLKAAGDAAGGHETEWAVAMKAGDTLVYNVEAPAGSNVWQEFHGHDDKIVTFYKKTDGALHYGSLTAPFDGNHGWYLKNNGATPVTVKITISGFYEPPAQ